MTSCQADDCRFVSRGSKGIGLGNMCAGLAIFGDASGVTYRGIMVMRGWKGVNERHSGS